MRLETEADAHPEGADPHGAVVVPTPTVSVCIVTRRRADLLRRCLLSLRGQDAPPPFELLVVADDDPDVERDVHAVFPAAQVLVSRHRPPGAARNLLVEAASGELLFFLDDDVVLPPDGLRQLAELADDHPDAGVFGGPNETPPGSTFFQVVQGAALASLVGAGPVRRRYGAHPAGPADERWFTLCNLAVRREVMTAFPDDVVCAEENAVLDALRRRHVLMRYDARLVAHHERRTDLRGFVGQLHKYGRGRGQLMARQPATTRPAFLAPAALVLYLLGAAPLTRLVAPVVVAAPIVLYAGLVAAEALRIAWTLRRARAAPLAAVLVPLLHLAYGTGTVRGIVEGRGRRRIGATTTTHASVRQKGSLLALLVERQIRLRAKRSWVAILWPAVAPLFLLVLYAFVFDGVFRVPIRRYPAFLFAGLLPWTFLAQSLGASVTSVSTEPELIRRARFPYELVPLAMVVTMSIYFFVTLAAFLTVLAVTGQLVVGVLPALVLPIAALVVLVAALALVLAAVDVYNRDLRQVLGNLLTVWFFLVPIVYRHDMVRGPVRALRSLDPVNVLVGQFREVLYYGRVPGLAHVFALEAACCVLFAAALVAFRRVAPRLPKDV